MEDLFLPIGLLKDTITTFSWQATWHIHLQVPVFGRPNSCKYVAEKDLKNKQKESMKTLYLGKNG